MLCRYCGKSLATVEGNVGTAHQCLGASPRQPDRESPSPVSSLIQPRLPRLRLIPDSAERRALRGQGRKREVRPRPESPNPEAISSVSLPQLVIDGLLPPEILRPHPEWESQPILEIQPFAPSPASPAPAPPKAPTSGLDELYAKVRSRQGDTRQTLQAIGELLLERKRYDEAAPIFDELIALAPESPQAQAGAGVCLENQGRWGEAAARFRMALDSNPNLPSALAGLGHCMLRSDNPALALVAFERCLATDPRHIPAAVGRIVSLQLVGRRDDAAQAYTEALRLHPDIQESLSGLMNGGAANLPAPSGPAERSQHDTLYDQGVAAFQSGQFEVALASFRNAARLIPQQAASWLAMGICLHQRDPEGAKSAYRAALEGSPDLAPARWNLALLQEKAGEFLEAGKNFARLAQAESARQEFWFRLAAALVRNGDFEGAFAAARKCPGLVGAGSNLYRNLGAFCWQHSEFPAAVRCFEEMLKISAGSTLALRALAAVTARMADYSRALDFHRRLYDAGDQSMEVVCNRAGLELRAGHPIAALAYFRQAADMQPDCKDASLGLEMARRASLEAHKLDN